MKTLRASRPLTIGDVMLIAIEDIGLQSVMGSEGVWLSGFKRVHAVVICDTNGIRALDTEAKNLGLDVLLQKVPELGDLLNIRNSNI